MATRRSTSKLWRMWGSKKLWVQSNRGEKRCWVYEGGAKSFFERVFRGDDCVRNWLTGVQGDLGQPDSRPTFPQPAPALLGRDEDIYQMCSALLGVERTSGDFDTELARRCVAAGRNVLRLPTGWTMCQSMRWLVCAAQGRLPGQEMPGMMQFATVPAQLTQAEWTAPTSHPCNDGRPCDTRYTTGDVFHAATCMLQRICRNGDAVFRLARGEPYRCLIDKERYDDLVRDLLRNSLNYDTHVDDYYSVARRRQ